MLVMLVMLVIQVMVASLHQTPLASGSVSLENVNCDVFKSVQPESISPHETNRAIQEKKQMMAGWLGSFSYTVKDVILSCIAVLVS